MLESTYTVAVRELCEFTAKQGDIDIRFTPAPSGIEGMAAHGMLAARRGGGYLKELSLAGRSGELEVRGRADGYDPHANRLDEFKTYRGELGRMRGNHRALHWAQLKIYGALLCRQRALHEVTLALVYFNVKTEQEDILEERHPAAALDAFFEAQCARFLDWARRELEHRLQRDCVLDRMPFPQASLREGQRQLAEAVYRVAMRGGTLMAQAPTGVGKTLGTLFPILKAAPKARLDKIFFLVAKTSGRRTGLEAARALAGDCGHSGDPRHSGDPTHSGTPRQGGLRVLEFVSRATACENPGKACTGEDCPLAAGFYDRLGGARLAMLDETLWDRETLRRVASRHALCPYYLAQEMLRWCDVAIGDYHYYFDTHAAWHALSVQSEWRVGVLIDEAHNLLPRARAMYSATRCPQALREALQVATGAVRRSLQSVALQWDMHDGACAARYTVHDALCDPLQGALHKFIAALNDLLDGGALLAPPLQDFYFQALHFVRMADEFGDHFVFDSAPTHAATETTPGMTLCLRNVAPAAFLAPRFATAVACVAFSATLTPREFHRRLLGLPDDTAWLDVASPFSAEQLTVHVQGHISTRFHRRSASFGPIADLIAGQFAAQAGTYLAFFSSFDYLEAVRATLRERHPDIPLWAQARQMTPATRDGFLARFVPGACGIGFAVLGGMFGEGIDLAGRGLAGAFIATLGLPQVNDINAEFERRMQRLFGAGYEFTYLYPGLQKVVQAAGRVIRGPTDRGTLHLIDDRFTQSRILELLPAWWQVRCD